MPLLSRPLVNLTEIITYWYFSASMFRFSEQVWKGMQMGEVMTLLTSVSGRSLVKSFSATDVIQQPFCTGKLFNVSAEPVSDLQSLSALLHRLESDPTHTVIRSEGHWWTAKTALCLLTRKLSSQHHRRWCMIDIDSLAWHGDLLDQKSML